MNDNHRRNGAVVDLAKIGSSGRTLYGADRKTSDALTTDRMKVSASVADFGETPSTRNARPKPAMSSSDGRFPASEKPATKVSAATLASRVKTAIRSSLSLIARVLRRR